MRDPSLAEIQSGLQTYCEQLFPEKQNLQVQNLISLNVGWESIIYRFDLHSDLTSLRQSETLILRIYPGSDAIEKSQREFEGLQHLYDQRYPVPRVYAIQREHSPFELPFILIENIPGETLWPVLDRAEPERAAALLSQFCELFAQLHNLDWRPFTPGNESEQQPAPYEFVDRYFAMVQNAAAAFPDLAPFLPIMLWLEERRSLVPCHRPSPIHWDFHPGNLILRPDGGMSVIDWTQIQVSDPRFDLGWTLLLAGAYSGDQVRNLILREYQRFASLQIEQLAFFEVANAVKRIGSVLISLSAGADQMGMRPDAVANMRRDFPALQRVYDLLVDRTGLRIAEIEALLAG